jgi:hypothetical protein
MAVMAVSAFEPAIILGKVVLKQGAIGMTAVPPGSEVTKPTC